MNVSIMIDGKEIGTTTSEGINVEYERGELKAGNNIPVHTFIKSMTYTTSLDNVTFDPSFFNKHEPENMYKLVATGWKLPKGKRNPKTKRILKKYKKKYTYTMEFEHVVLR